MEILQVLALVGFRKAMDFIPSVFSQKELYWLDNLMPASNKKEKKKKKKNKKDTAKEIATREASVCCYDNILLGIFPRRRRV